MKNERIHELEKQLLLLEMLVSAGPTAHCCCCFLGVSGSGLSPTPIPHPTPASLALPLLQESGSNSWSPDSCRFLGSQVAVTRAALGPSSLAPQVAGVTLQAEAKKGGEAHTGRLALVKVELES